MSKHRMAFSRFNWIRRANNLQLILSWPMMIRGRATARDVRQSMWSNALFSLARWFVTFVVDSARERVDNNSNAIGFETKKMEIRIIRLGWLFYVDNINQFVGSFDLRKDWRIMLYNLKNVITHSRCIAMNPVVSQSVSLWSIRMGRKARTVQKIWKKTIFFDNVHGTFFLVGSMHRGRNVLRLSNQKLLHHRVVAGENVFRLSNERKFPLEFELCTRPRNRVHGLKHHDLGQRHNKNHKQINKLWTNETVYST